MPNLRDLQYWELFALFVVLLHNIGKLIIYSHGGGHQIYNYSYVKIMEKNGLSFLFVKCVQRKAIFPV